MKHWIGSAPSLDEAVWLGLKSLGLAREQVEVQILEEKTSSLFSMMGFHTVRVKLTEKPGAAFHPPPPADQGRRSHQRSAHGAGDRAPGERARPPFERKDSSFDRNRNASRPKPDFRSRGESPSQKPFPKNPSGPPSRTRFSERDKDKFRGPLHSDRPSPSTARPAEGVPKTFGPAGPADAERKSSLPPAPTVPAAETAKPVPSQTASVSSENQERQPSENIAVPPESSQPSFENVPELPAENREERSLTEGSFASPVPGHAVEIPSTPEALLSQWKEKLGWEDMEWTVQPEEGSRVSITLKTSRGDRLMSLRGEGLDAFEHLFNLLLSRASKESPRVHFSVSGFVDPREQQIVEEARRAAAEVRRSRRVYRLDPMDAAERRLVHQTLAGEVDVETISEGEGPWRKVVVRPKTGGPGTGAGGR